MSEDHKTLQNKSPSQYVKLNVGGTLFYTSVETLTKNDNMLQAMFSGRMELITDSEDWVVIDRCGKHFGTILNYLRDGTVVLPENYPEIMELHAEAKYYLIEELTDSCQKALNKIELSKSEPESILRVHLTQSEEELKLLISTSNKPVVVLHLYYNSDLSKIDLQKNMELFDKLSLRFSSTVLFIKDVSFCSPLCCWNFYTHGKCRATVNCNSPICPESKIYEETLEIIHSFYIDKKLCSSKRAKLRAASILRQY